MASETFTPLTGQCTCGTVTYEVLAQFLCIHCCHCTWCQRETGTAFALNAMIESSFFRITSETKPNIVNAPSPSGKGQKMARCPSCLLVLYSHYGGADTWVTFVRSGTLDVDAKKAIKPDVHIFTSTKMDWVDLTGEKEKGVPVQDEYYHRSDVWRKDALERFKVLQQKMEEAKRAEDSR